MPGWLARGGAYAASMLVYAGIGGAAALVEWAVFYALVEVGRIDYIVAAIGGFAVATAANYLLSRAYGFRSRGVGAGSEIVAVYVVSGIALLVNLAVLVALVEGAGANIMAAKVAGTGAGFFLNYLGRQFWVFDPAPRHKASQWLKSLREKRRENK